MHLPEPSRIRRKRDGTEEWQFDCPLCGSEKNMEVNPQKAVWKCWACGRSGSTGQTPAYSTAGPSLADQSGVVVSDLDLLPLDHRTCKKKVLAYLEARGADAAWLVHRYGVQYDKTSGRLAWPLGAGGYALRAVTPWAGEKVKLRPPRGIIGYPRLSELKGRVAALTEGDFKSSAIPLPWVGLGICGVNMSREQMEMILNANPSGILVVLDTGKRREAEIIEAKFALTGIPVSTVLSEYPGGPDDWPRVELVRLLIEGEKKWR